MMAKTKEITEVSLRPIGAAIQKAQDELRQLAKKAPKAKSERIKEKIEALDIVHVQVQVLCRGSIKPYGFCKVLETTKMLNPPYGVSVKDY